MLRRTFKIAGRAFTVESHYGKVTENFFSLYNSKENSLGELVFSKKQLFLKLWEIPF